MSITRRQKYTSAPGCVNVHRHSANALRCSKARTKNSIGNQKIDPPCKIVTLNFAQVNTPGR